MIKALAILLIATALPLQANRVLNRSSGGLSLSTPVFETDALGPAAGSGTSYQFTAPSGIQENDIVIAKLTLNQARTITAPSGWTLKETVNNDSEGKPFVDYIYWKREDATPDATYNFTWAGATFRWGWIGRFSGAITTGDPFDAHSPSGYYVESTTVLPGATFTSTEGNVLGLAFYGIFEDATGSTPPSGWTEIQDAGATSGGVNCPLMVAIKDLTTAGSYEIYDASYTVNAGSSSIIVLGLLPAGGTIGSVSANTATVFFDFEASASGTTMTSALLRQSHFSDWHARLVDRDDAGAYTGMTFLTSPFGSAYAPSLVSAGVPVTGAGAMSFQHDHEDSAGGDGARLRFFPVSASVIEGGAASSQMYGLIQFNAVAPSSTDISIDHWVINKASGGFAVMQQTFNNIGTYGVRAHSATGSSTFGSTISITPGHLYWVSLLNDASGGSCEVRVYDAENGNALVGTSEADMSTGSNVTQVFFGGGYIESGATGTTVYDNVFYVDGVTGWPLVAAP